MIIIEKPTLKDHIADFISRDNEFRYRMLSRMKSDCYGFISHNGQLWYTGEPINHAKLMVALWDSLTIKPEWLTRAELKRLYYSLTKKELK